MSFKTVCDQCGAPSGPSVGVCPYCKSVMSSSSGKKANPVISECQKLYNEGRLDKALSLIKVVETKKPDIFLKPEAVLLYVKILIEVDGPSSKMRGCLSQALLENPNNPDLVEYMEVVDAKSKLSHGKDDLGEVELKNILRRSPKNVHAAFLLGSHLLWVEKDREGSLSPLEACVRLRPEFLRATACLGALYKQLGMDVQATRLFRKCASLETNKDMKDYFRRLAAG